MFRLCGSDRRSGSAGKSRSNINLEVDVDQRDATVYEDAARRGDS
jgi:hypothetical protein